MAFTRAVLRQKLGLQISGIFLDNSNADMFFLPIDRVQIRILIQICIGSRAGKLRPISSSVWALTMSLQDANQEDSGFKRHQSGIGFDVEFLERPKPHGARSVRHGLGGFLM